MTFSLPGMLEGERPDMGLPMVNAPKETVLTLRKRDVRNLVFFPRHPQRRGRLRAGRRPPERERVVCSALVTEAVYQDVRACLDWLQ